VDVETGDLVVTAPVSIQIISSSGANIEVFVFDGASPLARHAFKFGEPPFEKALPGLAPGVHQITVFALATKNLNRMYSVMVSFNHHVVAVADGDIPSDAANDSGSNSLNLTVSAAP
jgi:hypothetical protein